MARPLRIEYPGAVYHITSRGNAKNNIFLSDLDRHIFFEILSETLKRFQWLCHAFCLMDNHYHLLIETINPTLSRGMRHLNGVYTQSFNRRHNRVGHVFQGRYKAILVQKDTHLTELCRYVVLNPVRSKNVNNPEDWSWSSYIDTVSDKNRYDFLTRGWILSQFSSHKKEAQHLYQQFIKAGVSNQESIWNGLKGQTFYADDVFIKTINARIIKNDRSIEIPKVQRHADRLRLSDLLQNISNKPDRNRKIRRAYLEHGYKMKEIADFLSIHYTTVSKIIKQKK